MISVEIDPDDLRELMKDLKALRPDNLVKPNLDPMGKKIIQIAGKYPPPSGYPRTGHLGRSWIHQVFGLDLKIGNLASYAGWVHGQEQITVHRNRGWKRVFEVMEEQVSKLLDKIQKEIDKLWT